MGIKTYPKRRTEWAGVLDAAVAAGTIEFSSGSAMVEPTPLIKVLRGIDFLVMKFMGILTKVGSTQILLPASFSSETGHYLQFLV